MCIRDSKYILYTVEHIDKLYAKCIDEQLAYIHELNQFDLMIPRSMMIYTDVAILEAIRLYDELSKHTDNPNPFFDMDMNIKMPVISSIYLNNYVNNHPSLYYFQNNPIKKELVSAQFCLLYTSYLQASSIATATATVAPTIGLLPIPINPIIST